MWSSLLEPELVCAMVFRPKGPPRFKNRRDAERALEDIVRDGGVRAEYRIEEAGNGLYVILVLNSQDGAVVGAVGV